MMGYIICFRVWELGGNILRPPYEKTAYSAVAETLKSDGSKTMDGTVRMTDLEVRLVSCTSSQHCFSLSANTDGVL